MCHSFVSFNVIGLSGEMDGGQMMFNYNATMPQTQFLTCGTLWTLVIKLQTFVGYLCITGGETSQALWELNGVECKLASVDQLSVCVCMCGESGWAAWYFSHHQAECKTGSWGVGWGGWKDRTIPATPTFSSSHDCDYRRGVWWERERDGWHFPDIGAQITSKKSTCLWLLTGVAHFSGVIKLQTDVCLIVYVRCCLYK